MSRKSRSQFDKRPSHRENRDSRPLWSISSSESTEYIIHAKIRCRSSCDRKQTRVLPPPPLLLVPMDETGHRRTGCWEVLAFGARSRRAAANQTRSPHSTAANMIHSPRTLRGWEGVGRGKCGWQWDTDQDGTQMGLDGPDGTQMEPR